MCVDFDRPDTQRVEAEPWCVASTLLTATTTTAPATACAYARRVIASAEVCQIIIITISIVRIVGIGTLASKPETVDAEYICRIQFQWAHIDDGRASPWHPVWVAIQTSTLFGLVVVIIYCQLMCLTRAHACTAVVSDGRAIYK